MIDVKIIIALTLSLNWMGCTSPENSKKEITKKADFVKDRQSIDSLILAKFKNNNERPFIGTTVMSLLSDSIISKFKEYVFIDEKPGLLSFLSLKYSDKLYIEVVVNEYAYMNQFDEKRKWELEVFKKEEISEIRILFDDKVIEAIK